MFVNVINLFDGVIDFVLMGPQVLTFVDPHFSHCLDLDALVKFVDMSLPNCQSWGSIPELIDLVDEWQSNDMTYTVDRYRNPMVWCIYPQPK